MSPSAKAGRLKSQEAPRFQLKSKGQKRPRSQLKAVKQEECPSVLLRPSTDWTRPIYIRKNNVKPVKKENPANKQNPQSHPCINICAE